MSKTEVDKSWRLCNEVLLPEIGVTPLPRHKMERWGQGNRTSPAVCGAGAARQVGCNALGRVAPAPEAAAAGKCRQPERRRKWPLACRGPCAPGMSSRVSRRGWKVRGRCCSIGVTGKGRRHSSHSTREGAGKQLSAKCSKSKSACGGVTSRKPGRSPQCRHTDACGVC